MSHSNLLSIISMLPESCLERAITNCLYSLNISGNLELLEMIIANLLNEINGHETLKVEAAVIGVHTAVKSRNIPLAMVRFEKISKMENSTAVVNFKTDALFYLAAGLLPDNPTKLTRMWNECLGSDLPIHAQYGLAKIGIMLVRQFLKNQDKHEAKAICQRMRQDIDIAALGKEFYHLEKLIAL